MYISVTTDLWSGPLLVKKTEVRNEELCGHWWVFWEKYLWIYLRSEGEEPAEFWRVMTWQEESGVTGGTTGEERRGGP